MMAVTRLRLYDTHPVPSSIHHDDMRMLLFRLDVSFYDVDVQNLTIFDLLISCLPKHVYVPIVRR